MAPKKALEALAGKASFQFSKGTEIQAAAYTYLAILWATLNKFAPLFSIGAVFENPVLLPRHRHTEYDELGNSQTLAAVEPSQWKSLRLAPATGRLDGREEVLSSQAVSFFRAMGAAIGWQGMDSEVELFVISDFTIPKGHGDYTFPMSYNLDVDAFELMLKFLQIASKDELVPRRIAERLLDEALSHDLVGLLRRTSDFLVDYDIEGKFSEFDEYSEERLDTEQWALENGEFTAYRPSQNGEWKGPNPFGSFEAQSEHTDYLLHYDPDSAEALEGEDIEVVLSEEVNVYGSFLVKASSPEEALAISEGLFQQVYQIERIELLYEPEDREVYEGFELSSSKFSLSRLGQERSEED
jgi:hypothetical protein